MSSEKQKEFQDQAFSLISEAEENLRFDYYDEAIELYQKATDLLIQVGWGPQIKKIYKRINAIRKARDKYLKEQQESYYKDLEDQEKERDFQDDINKLIEKEKTYSEERKETYEAFAQKQTVMAETKEKLEKLIQNQEYLLIT